MTDYMFKSYAETGSGEYYLDPSALADVAGYPAVGDVRDGTFYGVEGTEYEGSLDVAGGGDEALRNIDPGVANVRKATVYRIHDVAKVGTLVVYSTPVPGSALTTAPVITYIMNEIAALIATACTVEVGKSVIIVPVIDWIKSATELHVQICEGARRTVIVDGGYVDEDIEFHVGVFYRHRTGDAQKHHRELSTVATAVWSKVDQIVTTLHLNRLYPTLVGDATVPLLKRPLYKTSETQIVKNSEYPGLLLKRVTFVGGVITRHPLTVA